MAEVRMNKDRQRFKLKKNNSNIELLLPKANVAVWEALFELLKVFSEIKLD